MSQNLAAAVLYEHIHPETDASAITLEPYFPLVFKAKAHGSFFYLLLASPEAFMMVQYVRVFIPLSLSFSFITFIKIAYWYKVAKIFLMAKEC